MQLLFPLSKTEELDDTPYSKSHTMSVLSICNVERCCTALHLAGEEREIHPEGCNEERSIENAADERIKPFELLVRKCRSAKNNQAAAVNLPLVYLLSTLRQHSQSNGQDVRPPP